MGNGLGRAPLGGSGTEATKGWTGSLQNSFGESSVGNSATTGWTDGKPPLGGSDSSATTGWTDGKPWEIAWGESLWKGRDESVDMVDGQEAVGNRLVSSVGRERHGSDDKVDRRETMRYGLGKDLRQATLLLVELQTLPDELLNQVARSFRCRLHLKMTPACSMVWHGMAWHGSIWHGMVLYGMVVPVGRYVCMHVSMYLCMCISYTIHK